MRVCGWNVRFETSIRGGVRKKDMGEYAMTNVSDWFDSSGAAS